MLFRRFYLLSPPLFAFASVRLPMSLFSRFDSSGLFHWWYAFRCFFWFLCAADDFAYYRMPLDDIDFLLSLSALLIFAGAIYVHQLYILFRMIFAMMLRGYADWFFPDFSPRCWCHWFSFAALLPTRALHAAVFAPFADDAADAFHCHAPDDAWCHAAIPCHIFDDYIFSFSPIFLIIFFTIAFFLMLRWFSPDFFDAFFHYLRFRVARALRRCALIYSMRCFYADFSPARHAFDECVPRRDADFAIWCASDADAHFCAFSISFFDYFTPYFAADIAIFAPLFLRLPLRALFRFSPWRRCRCYLRRFFFFRHAAPFTLYYLSFDADFAFFQLPDDHFSSFSAIAAICHAFFHFAYSMPLAIFDADVFALWLMLPLRWFLLAAFTRADWYARFRMPISRQRMLISIFFAITITYDAAMAAADASYHLLMMMLCDYAITQMSYVDISRHLRLRFLRRFSFFLFRCFLFHTPFSLRHYATPRLYDIVLPRHIDCQLLIFHRLYHLR